MSSKKINTKIKINYIQYQSETDTFKWNVKDISKDKIFNIVNIRQDIWKFAKIDPPKLQRQKELQVLYNFCKSLQGKEINWESELKDSTFMAAGSDEGDAKLDKYIRQQYKRGMGG